MRSIWQDVPARSFTIVLMAIFLTFVPMGFLTDVSVLGVNAPVQLVTFAGFSGLMAVGYFAGFRRYRWLLPLVIVLHLGSMTVFNGYFFAARAPLAGDALNARMRFDAYATALAFGLAYVCFMWFF